MHDIFISYAKEDEGYAQKLMKALKHANFSVWYDYEIPTGNTFDDVIEKAIEEAKCVLVLWSKNSIDSEWVRVEAAEGKKRNILVPVLVDQVEIPLAFRRRQAINLINWFSDSDELSFDRLVSDIRSLIKIKSSNGGDEENSIHSLDTVEHSTELKSEASKEKSNTSLHNKKRIKSYPTVVSVLSRPRNLVFISMFIIVCFSMYYMTVHTSLFKENITNNVPKGLVFASKIESNGQALDPSLKFSKDVTDIYAVFRTDKPPPGLVINADSLDAGSYYAYLKLKKELSLKSFGWKWYKNGKQIVDYQYPIKNKNNLWLHRHNYVEGVFGKFGTGTYKIVILLDGNPAISSELVIEDMSE